MAEIQDAWNRIIEYLGLQEMNTIALAAAAGLAALLLLAVLWLIFRGLRLWYWKVNRRARSLENIEKKLDSIQERIDKGGLVKVTVTDRREKHRPLGEQDEALFRSLEKEAAGVSFPPVPRSVFIVSSEAASAASTAPNEAVSQVLTSEQEAKPEEAAPQAPTPEPKPEEPAPQAPEPEAASGETAVARKTGRLYTREEIEKLIR